MKKLMTSLVLAAAAVGLFGASNVVRADTKTPNATTADTTDNKQVNASTDATVTFQGGTLSLYNVPDTTAFNSTDNAFKAQDIWVSGLVATPATTDLKASVDDYLSGDGTDGWTLTVAKGDWKDSKGQADTALNLGAHLLVDTDTNEITTTGYTFATGTYGLTDVNARPLNLKIDPKTKVSSGTYTNTLTWNLTDPATANQK